MLHHFCDILLFSMPALSRSLKTSRNRLQPLEILFDLYGIFRIGSF
jgi:hypothetical protein